MRCASLNENQIPFVAGHRKGQQMEQILIDLVAGALGGVGAGKSSPTFDLGMIGNIISGLVGGGVLGQIVTLLLPSVAAAGAVRRSEYWRHCFTSDRRWCWRGHTHLAHWCNQKQSRCLNVNGIIKA